MRNHRDCVSIVSDNHDTARYLDFVTQFNHSITFAQYIDFSDLHFRINKTHLHLFRRLLGSLINVITQFGCARRTPDVHISQNKNVPTAYKINLCF